MNALQRLLFGSGRLPEDLRASLVASDEVVFLEEGLTGSVTRRHFRSSGRLVEWERQAVSGAIAVTIGRRVMVWAGRFKHIDVPMTHPLWATIEFSIDRPNRVCFTYAPAATDPGQSGRVDVRLKTSQVKQLARLVTRPV
ncbi:hypothetical protein OHA40_00300 [Nocardia sp. NBC_00508]|uniref:hypothetical protein n=1 Tax=Nocardia sp. NBC_00508 TaxID=2975992 RepID=UPI002E8082D4|nr:hypothetical protein [Nocardia sp. NBC_00508]WUD66656.1 hypothetical protein OHA40_00300 [Nocardia sp. NBC_00508]